MVYGDVGNEPIKEDCIKFHSNEPPELNEAETYCHWRPVKKTVNKNGQIKFLLQTDCGRLVEYSNRGAVDEEIMTEVCQRCKRYIKVHYIRGME